MTDAAGSKNEDFYRHKQDLSRVSEKILSLISVSNWKFSSNMLGSEYGAWLLTHVHCSLLTLFITNTLEYQNRKWRECLCVYPLSRCQHTTEHSKPVKPVSTGGDICT